LEVSVVDTAFAVSFVEEMEQEHTSVTDIRDMVVDMDTRGHTQEVAGKVDWMEKVGIQTARKGDNMRVL